MKVLCKYVSLRVRMGFMAWIWLLDDTMMMGLLLLSTIFHFTVSNNVFRWRGT